MNGLATQSEYRGIISNGVNLKYLLAGFQPRNSIDPVKVVIKGTDDWNSLAQGSSG
jgi:hypothetical protein